MANIISFIEKSVEKEETLIDIDGNLFTPEKVKSILKKEYQTGLKDGTIDMESTSFKDYEVERMKDYISVNDILAIFQTREVEAEEESTESEEEESTDSEE